MQKKISLITRTLCCVLLAGLSACGERTSSSSADKAAAAKDTGTAPVIINDQTRIVSLSGTITETLCALGFEDKIVGVDVTSTFPETIQGLPKVGHNRNFSSESILAQKPTLVLGFKEKMKPELLSQIQGAHVTVVTYSEPATMDQAKEVITEIAKTMGVPQKAETLISQIDQDYAKAKKPAGTPKVLFIYARGAGMMMVGGEKTAVAGMIELAGGENAAKGFEDYKPLTPEALTSANPDIILMFTDGLKSVGGMDGLLKLPGVAATNAGKKRRVIEMDGQFLTGFGPRTGAAVADLAGRLSF